MKTRRGTSYHCVLEYHLRRQKLKTLEHDLFDTLPDDLVLSILAKLASTASCPADLISLLLTYESTIYSFFDTILMFLSMF